MYAIIDIETTGGRPQQDKITEIAILIHDGDKIIDEFVTLVNPERSIPYFITGLTGITNEMVADAPKFYEVARKIVEITDGKMFVAHNARFDYTFIREEFKRLGFIYTREILDTVKLSRHLIPGQRSYSLGRLCKELGIKITDRHRAVGDARATARLFEILRGLNQGDALFANPALSDLHPDLDPEKVRSLPEQTGVYYLHNEKRDVIYIGKSRNIASRVQQHLANRSSRRSIEMRDSVADISVEITGSELVACLLESDEIKKHKPLYNRAQRRESSYTGIYSYTDENGYLRFELGRKNHLPLATFSTVEKARECLTRLTDDYHLCQKLTGLYQSKNACFQHQIGICFGACTGKEPPSSYNERAARALRGFEYDFDNFLIIDRGRRSGEKSVVKVEHGRYQGFGYFDADEAGMYPEILHECITPYPDNRDVQSIIKRHLRNNDLERIIPF
jgi:DNA polymerase-3 subunit epsilon